ncbi:MAG: DNA topoisomerase IV subunit A [Nanoarchaeota archaeon]|nr:DNA topoisomerase IV subunit A [Nanoarchaeota archaeon]
MKIDHSSTIKKLAKLGEEVLEQLEKKKNPEIDVRLRSLNNVYFDEKDRLIRLGNKVQKRSFFNLNQSKKFMQTMLIASLCKELLEQDKPPLSIRQIYYALKRTLPNSNENTFDAQKETDPLIEDIEVIIDALREELNLIATPKGVIAGPLTIRDKTSGDDINLAKMGSAGYSVPAIVEKNTIDFKHCSADYVLVIEKYAMWNIFNRLKFWDKNNCIIITGKGQPARAERRLLQRIHDELKLPVYVMMDMDAYGYYIYSVYKQGSINLAYFSEKCAVPDAKFLGLKVSDYENFSVPKTALIKATKSDMKRLDEIKKYDWFKTKEWQKELKDLKNFGYKIELDSMVTKGVDFAVKNYVPTKIENKDWLD